MKKFRGTKGEWKKHNSYVSADGLKIVSTEYSNLGEMQANLLLIAAAPDLLKDAISDVELIKDFIENGNIYRADLVEYFLKNLLVSKTSVINKSLGYKK